MESGEFKDRFLGLHRQIYRVAYSILETEKDAEDAVQEVYIKLWQLRDRLDDIRNDEAFAIRMAKNLALDMLRESYHKRTTLLDPDQETESDEWLEHTLMAKDQLSVVMDCLKKLPASQQKVMQLRHFADLSIPEIANVTQYTEVNIRQLLSRARSAMKAQLALIERHEP
jgi:RNA polymerase sigma factor, sigma-70 family